ncbi:MAG: penicillin-binding protein 2, partial [Bacteroidetes bacterium]|nr:penicillin-binding protein 2 [Bacteroidota bacterium]
SRRNVTQYPARGLILDRNGKLIVYNEAAYDLMVTPAQTEEFDTTELCKILDLPKQYLVNTLDSAKNYSPFKPSEIVRQMSAETYARLQEKLYKFQGFYVQSRTLRKYNYKVASHLLGYVGEVDQKIINKNPYYKARDYIGVSGLERTYEEELRGQKGVNILLVDVHNRVVGSYLNGKYDTTAIAGNDLTSTLDADLQQYAEHLMQKMHGSVVAIEPSTGEILVMASLPTYDPSLLVGRVRRRNFSNLLRDTLSQPLFDRAVMAVYPPGSTFKLINGLIGLQENVLVPENTYGCAMGYHYGNKVLGCHQHPSPLNLIGGIQNSCNAYFCHVFRNILDNKEYPTLADAYNMWRYHVLSFGFGKKLGTDLPNELNGNIPDVGYYDRYHGKGRWKSLTVISLSIGQGELGITPLQMANMAATMANRGFYYTPHLVKKIKGKTDINPKFREKHFTDIDTTYFSPIIEGMSMAVKGGTATIARMPDIEVCAKTGTAQNPHGEDHSIFIAFAPRDNPKIAISVYVENGGFGATWAGPIASLLIEKYLKDTISRPWLEQHLLNFNKPYKK